MAMGIFPGAGGVKEAKEIYLGAGGVKTVKEVYVGQGGSVKKVWPAYTDYGGTSVDLYANASSLFSVHNGYMLTNATKSGYDDTASNFGNLTNTDYGTGSGANGHTTSFNANCNCHWYSVGPIDTRGYNYLLVHMRAGAYRGDYNTTYRIWPIIGYNSTSTNNPYYGGHYAISSIFNFGATTYNGIYNTSAYYFLYDFTNINEESTYLQFGGQLVISDTEGQRYCGIAFDSCVMSQDKPSSYDTIISF